jgi:Tat protein translocase TatB subunit
MIKIAKRYRECKTEEGSSMHISFSEILVILLVALLVIKPEHLPDAAQTLGRWMKWLRTATHKIKQEMEEPFQPRISDQHEQK